MLITLFVAFGLSLLVLVHEAGHFFAARFFGLRVEEFGLGFPPRVAARKRGETTYSFNAIPFGGFVKIAGEIGEFALKGEDPEAVPEGERRRLFMFQPPLRRAAIILAGVAVNFVAGWLLLSSVFMTGTPPVVVITGISPNSPATEAGLRRGDILVNFETSAAFTAFINENRGKAITLTVRSRSAVRSVKLTPRINPPQGEGAIGVLLAEGGIPREGFFSAFYDGLKQASLLAGSTLLTFGGLLRDLVFHGKLATTVVGPVGIFSLAQETGALGFAYLVQLLSLISINLAVINLLPFPALDGGRFAMILVEKFRGVPVSRRTEAVINGVGFVFLILLMLVITVRDVVRIL